MKKALIFSSILLVLILLVSCGSAVVAVEAEQELTKIEDDGMIAEIVDGTYLVVDLDGNPTTGYEWTYKINDENVLQCIKSEYVQAENKGMVGVGGTYHFVFEAKGAGNSPVVFSYGRSWEASTGRYCIINVTVDQTGNLHFETGGV